MVELHSFEHDPSKIKKRCWGTHWYDMILHGITALRSWGRYRAQVCSICEWVENACIKENMDEQWLKTGSQWNNWQMICSSLSHHVSWMTLAPFPSVPSLPDAQRPKAWILASQTASDGGICTRTQSIGEERNTSLWQLVTTQGEHGWLHCLQESIEINENIDTILGKDIGRYWYCSAIHSAKRQFTMKTGSCLIPHKAQKSKTNLPGSDSPGSSLPTLSTAISKPRS